MSLPNKKTRLYSIILLCTLSISFNNLHAATDINHALTNTKQYTHQLTLALEKLKNTYPKHIHAIIENTDNCFIVWHDGMHMPIRSNQQPEISNDPLNNPSLADQLLQPQYSKGQPKTNPSTDPGRIRYEPFFRKMYGNSPEEVENHLTTIAWMPNVFGQNAHILRVTTINNIHEKIQKISDELELLVERHPEYIELLNNPGGTYNWRNIANTTRLSNHSFGMTLDINASLTHYWQWDLKTENIAITEDAPLTYRNTVPWEIIHIFEKYGFIWGGKWYHYDTMHFEYRPELFNEHK